MKKSYLFQKLSIQIIGLLMASIVHAQAPQRFNYQSVIRDVSSQLAVNQPVGVQISVLQGSASGSAVYTETHVPTSNANGLVSLEIGTGTVVTGDFTAIDWANGPYFIQTETDPTGGSSYTITSTSQLMSVPYALYAETSGNGLTNGTAPGQMQYWDGTEWVTIATTENEGATLQMIGGVPTWTGGTPPPPEVTNPTTGKIWMDRNLGAAQVATSSTDANSYGDLYQWGRGTDGHQIRTSPTTSTLSSSDSPGHGDFIITSNLPFDWRSPQNTNLWQGVNGVNNPCPSGYRLPTETELNAERLSWSSQNAAGAFASPLKLPAAGIRPENDGALDNVGFSGYYWSSTVLGSSSRHLYFDSGNAFMNFERRASGLSVRCIKD